MKFFVTGKLAHGSLSRTLESLGGNLEYRIVKMNITVAALMDTRFIAKNLERNGVFNDIPLFDKTEIIIPGRCRGNIGLIEDACRNLGIDEFSVLRGPIDLRDIPEFLGFSRQKVDISGLPRKTIVIAEIADAPMLSIEEIHEKAAYYITSGADIVDIGCIPGEEFPLLGEAIKSLKAEGMKISIDSLDVGEIKQAVQAGADMVLSINSSNLQALEVGDFLPVIIPDMDRSIKSLKKNIEAVENHGRVDYLIDPILDPIGFGFRNSLSRFMEIEQIFPGTKRLMGVGNIIELTDADSTGLNALLAGLIVESGIEYVLTTEASNRTRGSVREIDLAIKMISFALREGILPKGISEDLLTIKQEVEYFSEEELMDIKNGIRDRNYRIFIDGKRIHIFNRDTYLTGFDPDDIFSRIPGLDESSHAFYLGRELQKAHTAILLGKRYRQDDPQEWGYLSFGKGRKKIG